MNKLLILLALIAPQAIAKCHWVDLESRAIQQIEGRYGFNVGIKSVVEDNITLTVLMYKGDRCSYSYEVVVTSGKKSNIETGWSARATDDGIYFCEVKS